MTDIGKILEGVEFTSLTGDKNPVISGIEFDSRKVISGSLFVAVKGQKTDGHDYIDLAIKSGASAILLKLWASLLQTFSGILHHPLS
jgi:UDP-N-acetylmuramoyl-L-alanyl-D-glutamate--2,6-diaminopimelate ligase